MDEEIQFIGECRQQCDRIRLGNSHQRLLRASASHLAAKPRHLCAPMATARDQPGSRVGEMTVPSCSAAGCRHRPKNGSGFARQA